MERNKFPSFVIHEASFEAPRMRAAYEAGENNVSYILSIFDDAFTTL